MCGTIRRERHAGPYDGETQKLELPREGGERCGAHFPWQTLWLIWPLIFVFKGAFFLAGPALAWLSQPLVLTVAPLPLLLVGAGALLLLAGSRRQRE